MGVKHLRILILLVVATALIAIAASGPSAAQITPQIERLHVDLWPEFDRPDMLIIFRGTLANDVPLPATLAWRLPARVGEPHAVAYDDGSGSLLEADYSTQRTDDWLVVTLETHDSDFQLEFYDSLTQIGERRSYTFVWPGDYAVGQLDLFLLPPPGANDIQTEPLLSLVEQGQGLSGYAGTLQNLPLGQTSQVTLSYDGAAVAVGEAVVSPSREAVVSPGREDNDNTPLIVGATFVAVVLAIGGSVWYTRRARPQPAAVSPDPQRPARRKGRAARKRPAQAKSSAVGYCTQCGHSLRTDDRFCGQCGTLAKGEMGK